MSITSVPASPEKQFAEILLRVCGIDVQTTDNYLFQFACFLSAFTDIDGFESMPWEERANCLRQYYGAMITDRTLRNWCSKLIKTNAIAKVSGVSYWKTEYENGVKLRTRAIKEDVAAYYDRRREIVQQETGKNVLAGMPVAEAKKKAWKDVHAILWAEYHCCYYYCKSFLLSAFTDEGISFELLELARQISRKEEPHEQLR